MSRLPPPPHTQKHQQTTQSPSALPNVVYYPLEAMLLLTLEAISVSVLLDQVVQQLCSAAFDRPDDGRRRCGATLGKLRSRVRM